MLEEGEEIKSSHACHSISCYIIIILACWLLRNISVSKRRKPVSQCQMGSKELYLVVISVSYLQY